MSAQARFFLLNAIGGVAVLGSYVWGIAGYPELREGFWGGVPKSWQGIYTLNMFPAALGFILAFVYFLRNAKPAELASLRPPYLLILLPSALWLPLTVAVLKTDSQLLWWLTRIDLFLVAIGGLWLLARLHAHRKASASRFGLFAELVMVFFVFQTTVLDALVWPALF